MSLWYFWHEWSCRDCAKERESEGRQESFRLRGSDVLRETHVSVPTSLWRLKDDKGPAESDGYGAWSTDRGGVWT